MILGQKNQGITCKKILIEVTKDNGKLHTIKCMNKGTVSKAEKKHIAIANSVEMYMNQEGVQHMGRVVQDVGE